MKDSEKALAHVIVYSLIASLYGLEGVIGLFLMDIAFSFEEVVESIQQVVESE